MRSLRVFLLVIVGVALLSDRSNAQELNCSVTVDYSALAGNEFQFLSELQEELERYLNNRSWTDDVFLDRERINCNFGVVFTVAQGLSRFQAQVVVGSSRPIYGSGQRTNVFQIQDSNWTFDYNRGQGLIYNPNQFNSFTSLIDFYALLILGYDYDTFSELGGQEYFETAREISELARGVNAEGWHLVGDERTRGALITQLLDQRYLPLRRAYFDYHYGVLDHFTTDHQQAWEDAVAVIESLHELYLENNTRRYSTDIFFSSKHLEIATVLEDYPNRAAVYEYLIEMDQPHQQSYDQLVN